MTRVKIMLVGQSENNENRPSTKNCGHHIPPRYPLSETGAVIQYRGLIVRTSTCTRYNGHQHHRTTETEYKSYALYLEKEGV
jgi:hypothetical protein